MSSKAGRLTKRILATGIVLSIILLATFTHSFSNLWGTLSCSNYLIPEESNLFQFEALLINSGSGDWWIYGMDHKNYYFNNWPEYEFISKKEAEIIQQFDQLNHLTWRQ